MALNTRRASFPRILIERETDSEESSSEEEEEEEEEGEEVRNEEAEGQPEEGGEVEVAENGGKVEEVFGTKKKEKKPITITLKKICKVSFSISFWSFLFLTYSSVKY